MNLANILHSLTHEPRKAKDLTLSHKSCVHNYIVPVIQSLNWEVFQVSLSIALEPKYVSFLTVGQLD